MVPPMCWASKLRDAVNDTFVLTGVRDALMRESSIVGVTTPHTRASVLN